jgi:hypothetical protein
MPSNDIVEYQDVERLLLARGYSAPRPVQISRNIVGTVEGNGHPLLFKVAAAPGRNFSTYNEIMWNNTVYTSTAMAQSHLRIPRLYDYDTYKNRIWFVREYFQGEFLTDILKTSRAAWPSWMSEAADALASLMLVRPKFHWTPADEGRLLHANEDLDIDAWLNVRMSFYLKRLQSPPFSIGPLVKILEAGGSSLADWLQHGDYVPRHMVILNGEAIGLLDSELGGRFLPQHYDAACFYHEVYTLIGSRDGARLFLKRYRERVMEAAGDFDREFRIALAHRTLGGLGDEKRLRREHLPMYESLLQDMERGRLQEN